MAVKEEGKVTLWSIDTDKKRNVEKENEPLRAHFCVALTMETTMITIITAMATPIIIRI